MMQAPTTSKPKLRMSIRWKLIIPFLLIIVLVVAVLLPITSNVISNRIENEADNRLRQSAASVAALLEQSQRQSLVDANFVAGASAVQSLSFDDQASIAKALTPLKQDLGLQELSYYAPTFKAGD